MRYFLELSYNGQAYHGWQVQDKAETVQQRVNEALSTILREDIACMGSGRTDAGVHALMQVAHFDCEAGVGERVVHKLNGILPTDIAVLKLYPVVAEASARFDAISRSYIYRIHQHKDPFLLNRSYLFKNSLDVDLMNEGCTILKRSKDFESFSKVHTEVNNFLCNIFEANWEIQNEKLIFSVRANRFLRGMVRALVGTMLDLGQGKITLSDLEKIIQSRDRKMAGRSVPAMGLYLSQIQFPSHIIIN